MALVVGCRRGEQPPSATEAGGNPFVKTPAALDRALLLYQDGEGILLSRPAAGEAPRRVAPGGRYPRWLSDGRHFVFIRGNDVLLHDLDDGSEIVLASPGKPGAVAVNAVGDDVFFIADRAVYRVRGAVAKGELPRVEAVLQGADFREIAIHGDRIVTTTGIPLRGYGVYVHEPPYGDERRLGKGCSAGLSPDGTLATINLDGHTELALIDVASGERRGVVPAPAGRQLDNQCWSNHPDWIAAVSHENRVYLQRVPDGAVWAVVGPEGDRPSLFVPR